MRRLRAADVLLIGVRGLGSDIAKNIILAGINSLTILDDGEVTQEDLRQNFLLQEKIPLGNKVSRVLGVIVTDLCRLQKKCCRGRRLSTLW